MGLFGNWRRKAPEESVPPAEEERYLEFDSFPFKLAVVQELMYEQKLLGEPYRGGDAFMERYAGDLETVSEETALQRLLPHIFSSLRWRPWYTAFRVRHVPKGSNMICTLCPGSKIHFM